MAVNAHHLFFVGCGRLGAIPDSRLSRIFRALVPDPEPCAELSLVIGTIVNKLIATMSFATRSSLVRAAAATRGVAVRNMATEPKAHKAKDMWAEFKKSRPPKDHLDEHVSLLVCSLTAILY